MLHKSLFRPLRILAWTALTMACAHAPSIAAQEEWPSRPVRMVVPFPVGGTTDIAARLLASQLGRQLGQTISVQNISGANGVLGMGEVARSDPDGYTLLYTTSSVYTSPALFPTIPLDPTKAFIPIAMTAVSTQVLLAHPGVPATDLPSTIDYLRRQQGQSTYGSSGIGNISHLVFAQLLHAKGLRALHVPYRGSAPALSDLASGEVQFLVNPISNAIPLIRAKKLKAIAVFSAQRDELLPDVPTVAESGMAELESGSWQGVLAPTGTPAAIVQKLNAEIIKALNTPELREAFKVQGIQIVGTTPQAYADFLRTEGERWIALVKAGITLN